MYNSLKMVFLLILTLFFIIICQGKNSIEINTGFEDEMCGLVPVGSLCEHVTTSGLKYNLGTYFYSLKINSFSANFD